MARLDERLIDQVRLAPCNDIVEVISEHLSLTRKGRDFLGLCPFHQDKNPSLHVNPSMGIFKCFVCGAGGDVFKFLQLRENLSFMEALERLADKAGIEISRSKNIRKSSVGAETIDPLMLARVNDWAMRFWQAQYSDEKNGKIARDYIDERKIDQDVAKQWLIGFAPDSWDALTLAASKAGISESLLVSAGLVVKREAKSGCYDKFRNRLMFPILDTSGRVIGFGGRTLGDDNAKYMNSPVTALFDKSSSLYGLGKARHSIVKLGKVIVVEGYTDVIMSSQYGIENVVAALGTSFTQGHARMLKRFASEIIMVLDSDDAGVAAANRALEVCLSQNIDVRIATVPEGKDPCEFLLARGGEAFSQVIDSAQDVLSYKWQRFKGEFDSTDSTVKKKQAIQEYLSVIAKAINSGYLDSISRGLIVRRVSSLIGISGSDINKELAKLGSRQQRSVVASVKNSRVTKVGLGEHYQDKAIQDVLEVLLNEPSLFDRVSSLIDVSRIESPLLRQIATLLFEILETQEKFEITDLLGRVEDVAISSTIVDLSYAGREKSNYLSRIESSLDVIKSLRIDKEIDAAKRNISDDESLRKITKSLRDVQADKRNKSNLRKSVIF